MGPLISAKCKCGYERRMALGGGMRNHLTYCAFPCYCQDCKSLYVADLFSNDTSCEECGSQNTVPYDDNSMRLHKTFHSPVSQMCMTWNAQSKTLYSAGVSGAIYAWDPEKMEEKYH